MTYDDAGSGARTARRHDRQEGCLDRPRDPLPTRVDDSPPLAPAYGAALDAALAEVGTSLGPGARAAIDGHIRLLLAWTDAINLTAIRDPVEVAIRHVVDSLTALPVLERRAVRRLVDLGSGGGCPGLPLAAAAGLERVRLVESVAKKARFLQTTVEATGLADRVEVLALRAEALAVDRARTGRWDAVTARAVAPLADLVELAFPLLADEGRLVAWKRGELTAELEAARRAVGALGGGTIEVIDVTVPGLAGHRLVVATRRGRVPDAYPRDPATRDRRPW